jgi:hypothetical protein
MANSKAKISQNNPSHNEELKGHVQREVPSFLKNCPALNEIFMEVPGMHA